MKEKAHQAARRRKMLGYKTIETIQIKLCHVFNLIDIYSARKEKCKRKKRFAISKLKRQLNRNRYSCKQLSIKKGVAWRVTIKRRA